MSLPLNKYLLKVLFLAASVFFMFEIRYLYYCLTDLNQILAQGGGVEWLGPYPNGWAAILETPYFHRKVLIQSNVCQKTIHTVVISLDPIQPTYAVFPQKPAIYGWSDTTSGLNPSGLGG